MERVEARNGLIRLDWRDDWRVGLQGFICGFLTKDAALQYRAGCLEFSLRRSQTAATASILSSPLIMARL